MNRIIHGDILSFARYYKGEPFHALICDAPYHLTSITDRFGKEDSAPAQEGNDGAFKRLSTGFMGKSWDGGDIAFRPETWRAFWDLLYPGAFGMTFGGSRTAHRMAVAIEDAGYIIHPMIGWVYSTGFPKATRIKYNCSCGRKEISEHDLRPMREGDLSQTKFTKEEQGETLRPRLQEQGIRLSNKKAMPKQGIEDGKESSLERGNNLSQPQGQLPTVPNKIREVSDGISGDGKEGQIRDGTQVDNGEDGKKAIAEGGNSSSHRPQSRKQQPRKSRIMADQQSTQDGGVGEVCSRCGKPIIEDNPFEGYRYGMQALKPALEPIIVFQKPYEGRPVDDITRTGAGAMNIEGGRIGTDGGVTRHTVGGGESGEWRGNKATGEETNNGGRWPANFIIQHSPDCKQIGTSPDGYTINRFTDGAKPFGDAVGEDYKGEEVGGESAVWQCVDGCPARELDRQSGQSQDGIAVRRYGNSAKGIFPVSIKAGSQDVGFGGSGGASRFFFNAGYAYEKLENDAPFKYQAKAAVVEREDGLIHNIPCIKCGELHSTHHLNDKGEDESCRRNGHPTIKTISLIKHLATLLLPPDEYAPRRIFVPFAGTGSEMIGAYQAGWECVIGVEKEAEYVEIAKPRIDYWEKQGIQLPMFE